MTHRTNSASQDGLIIKYYQHSESSTRPNESWQITDFGHVGEYSRDGSVHSTDEVFNAASHLSAAFLSMLGSVLLISQASAEGNAWKVVSFSIYGTSLVALFSASTLHHALVGPMEEFFRMIDYLAIYPLIGGTFTPLCLVFYHNSVIGWAFLCTVWGIALLSMIALACYFHKIPRWLSMTTYITLGWLGACMTYWLWPVLGFSGFGLFLLGGVLYTVGGHVFMSEQPNPWPGKFGFHEIWHVAVVLAALVHWCMMYFYVLPWQDPKRNNR